MTRFNISLDDGVDMVFWALEQMSGGEIFVPKIPSYRILDVAEAVCPNCEKPVVGIRPGEKIHEEMITVSDSYNTVDLGKYFAILPVTDREEISQYAETHNGSLLPEGWSYDSGNNTDFLSIEDLRALISEFRIVL